MLLRLYEATGGAPLAIKWAVGEVKQRGQSLDAVLNYLYEARGDIFEKLFARSWSLLSENTRHVLMVMPIFATSASKPAIEAASDVHKWDLDEALGQLVEMWLVETSLELDEAKHRYSIHPLTRAFAGARLGEDRGFEREAISRIEEYFLEFCSQYGGDDWRSRQYTDVDQYLYDLIELERENIVLVLEWFIHARNWEPFIRLWRSASYFFYIRGYWNELAKYGDLMLQTCRECNDLVDYAQLIAYTSWSSLVPGQYAEAVSQALEARKIYDKLGDPEGVAFALRTMGIAKLREGDFAGAGEFLQETYSLANKANSWGMKARIKKCLGDLACTEGRYPEAGDLYREAVQLNQEHDSLYGSGICLMGLGRTARQVGDIDEARDHLRKSLALLEEAGSRKDDLADAKRELALVEEKAGGFQNALDLLKEALALYDRLGMHSEAKEAQALVERLEGKLSPDR